MHRKLRSVILEKVVNLGHELEQPVVFKMHMMFFSLTL